MTDKAKKLCVNYGVEFGGKRYVPGGEPLPADLPDAVLADLKKMGAVSDEDEQAGGAALTAAATDSTASLGQLVAAELKAAHGELKAKEDEIDQLRERLEESQRDTATLEAEAEKLRTQVEESRQEKATLEAEAEKLRGELKAALDAAQAAAGAATPAAGSKKK